MNIQTKDNCLVNEESDRKCKISCQNDINIDKESCVPNKDISVKSERIGNSLDQTISNESRKKISNLLDEVGQLSDLEKLFLYVQLPTGSSPIIIDSTKQRYLSNPLSKKGDIEIAQTYTWIQSHLEEDPDISLPKHEVYEEYRNFFEVNQLDPLCAADFGKVMKHVFPSVKPRRLGTRGNSRYCYSGLKKRSNIKPPSLQDFNIGADLYDSTCAKESSEIDNAASHLICEWAEKLLSKKFYSVKELAIHLVENLYIDTQSVAALTLLSTTSQNKDIGCLANTLFKQTNGGKKRKQVQVQPQKYHKEQKKKVNKYTCTNTNNFKKQEIKKLSDKVQSNVQHSNQDLKISNTYKLPSADIQNTLPVKEHVNTSYVLSDVPSTSSMNKKFTDKCVESQIFSPSTMVVNDIKRKFSNNNFIVPKEGNDVNSLNQNIKNGEKYSSKSVDFNKFDYENAYYNHFPKSNTSRDNFLSFKKECFENASMDSVRINITKCPRMDMLTSDFNANILPSIHELENKTDNFIQTSSGTLGILPNKNVSIQENTLPENASLQNSENIHETNKNMQTNSSQLRMLLEKNLSPVSKSKITITNNDQSHLSNCNPIITTDENKNTAQNILFNDEAKALKSLFSNMEEHLKKDNYHSAKLSLIAETHNKSMKLATDFQEINRENIHSESNSLLYSHDVPNSQKIMHKGNSIIPNIHSSNDATQSKSFNFVPVSIKQDFYNREFSFDSSNSLQIPEKSVNPVVSINNQKMPTDNMHKDSREIHQNYSQPNSPFLFPQEAFPLVGRPRHHSSHNIGRSYNKFVQNTKHYSSYQSGSRVRHFSGPTYSKPDTFLETHIYGSDPALGNKYSLKSTSFSPLHNTPVSSADLRNNTNEMINKASQHLSDIAVSTELSRRNCSEASHHFDNAKKIRSNTNQIPPSSAVVQAPDDFSNNFQQLFLNKQPSLNINRCQSVPPHKMLQMLIDQNSPVNSPMISKSYPTTPVVNQIFQFPVSQYEPDISVDPSKFLSENNQGVSNILMEEWHSINISDTNNNAVCQPTMTELLEQPLDELQTTLEDLKECDEFSRFTQHLEKP